MDKTTHPSHIIVITYTLMGFCWAGKLEGNFIDMLLCAFACCIMGLIMVILESKSLPTYICRLFAAFAAVLVVFIAGRFHSYQGGVFYILQAVLLPIAAGAMLVEGMCTFDKAEGKKKIIISLLCSVALAAGLFAAGKIVGGIYG